MEQFELYYAILECILRQYINSNMKPSQATSQSKLPSTILTKQSQPQPVQPPQQKDKKKVSDMLEEETKKMEDKLEMVKKMMEIEKDKRSQQVAATKKGNATKNLLKYDEEIQFLVAKDAMWRSATTQKQISGYSQMVLNTHKQAKESGQTGFSAQGKENQSQGSQFFLQFLSNSIDICERLIQQYIFLSFTQGASGSKSKLSSSGDGGSKASLAVEANGEKDVETFLTFVNLAKYILIHLKPVKLLVFSIYSLICEDIP